MMKLLSLKKKKIPHSRDIWEKGYSKPVDMQDRGLIFQTETFALPGLHLRSSNSKRRDNNIFKFKMSILCRI